MKIDNFREEDWKSMARIRLRKFEEELQAAIEGGMNTYSGHTTWNFVNAVLYCFDISTTIGKPRKIRKHVVIITYYATCQPKFILSYSIYTKMNFYISI